MIKKWLICTFLIIYSFAFGYSEQVVVAQFDSALKDTAITKKNKENIEYFPYIYSLNNLNKKEQIKAIQSTNLSDAIDFSWSTEKNFNEFWFNPGTVEYKSAIIPVNKNTEVTTKTGTFQLAEKGYLDNGEDVTSYLIKEEIVLPAKTIELSPATASTGIKYTYTDTAKAQHLSAYKKQEFIIRIAKASAIDTNYDIVNKTNGIQLANTPSKAKSFLEGGISYIDFLVTGDLYDKGQSITTDAGVSLKFMPGNVEVFGLPKGSYRIELYSFRYSKEVTTKGNVIITKEDNESFTVGDTEFLAEGIDIINFSSGSFPTIKATILTVGNTTSPAIIVKEDGVTTSASITATTGAIYLDSLSAETAIAIGGTQAGALYYQLWDVTYTTSNSTINTNTREVTYTMNGTFDVKTTYNVLSTSTDYSGNPNLYQTVFVTSTNETYGDGTYEIDDRIMNKYSDGYRQIRKLDTSAGIEALYKGISGGESMGQVGYNWTGTTNRNSFVISKVISDSKGIFRNTSDTSDGFTFYTTTWTPAIDYKEKSATTHTDTANFSWSAPNKTSYDTSISEDKVIFRMLKSGTNSENYRYKPEDNSNPIKSSDLDLTAFLKGTTQYFDAIFTSGEDGKLAIGDVVFNFSKNNTLQIVGLTAGDYMFQIYSLQDEDTVAKADTTYDFRVLTYGGLSDVFTMGLPILETGDFKNQNNIYLIDSISVDSYLDNDKNPKKDVEVGIIIKAEETIANLAVNTNLVAKKDEVSTTDTSLNLYTENKVTEMWNNDKTITPPGIYTNIKSVVSPVTLTKADKSDFQYPLDIMFLIDNSGSMQNEIDSVKNGLDEFSSMLTAKGYDVKFNLITFGPHQSTQYNDNGTLKYPTGNWHNQVNDNTINNGYLAIYKSDWFNYTAGSTFATQKANELSQLKDAFSNINALWGYKDGQENGAWAIHHGIDKLKTNERYLNRDFQIINRSSNSSDNYLPSKKWIILLTDENMDTNSFPIRTDGGTAYSSTNVIDEFASQLSSEDITLTGIYHTKVITQNQTTLNNYLTLPGSSYSTQTWWGERYIINIIDKLSHNGEIPADTGNTFYSEFALKGLGSKFNMYEMGNTGQYVAAALKDSISNIGIIQRWNLNYTSPFPENDGKDREVIFSLKGLRKISSVSTSGTITYSDLDITSAVQNGSRIYNVPERKVLAYFINPNGAELEKTSSGIILEAKAQSQYTDSETGMKVNYPITKGTFIISGNYSNDGTTIGTFVTKVVSSDDTNNERVKLTNYDDAGIPTWWWNAKSTITNEEFKRILGKNPVNVKITFIAETVEESYSISQAVTIVDKIPPVITDFKMTNVTLRDFMSGLKDFSSTPIFDITSDDIKYKYSSTPEATTDGAITLDSFTEDKKLNVKDGDKVSIEITIDDESITGTSQGVKINGIIATYAGIDNSDSTKPYKTKWTVEIPVTLGIDGNIISNIDIDITDDSAGAGNLSGGNRMEFTASAFKQPNLLANTTLIAPTSLDRYTGDTNTEYYNTKNIDSTPVTGALAYLMVFDYDKAKSDKDASYTYTYPVSASSSAIEYMSSLNGKFTFGEGEHKYKEVYVLNQAGAIGKLNSSTLESVAYDGTLTNALAVLDSTANYPKSNIFYIDTVSPLISGLSFRKDSDPSLSDVNLLNNNSIASGILIGNISGTRPYKSGDAVSINANVKDYNFMKTTLSQVNSADIISAIVITAGGINIGVTNGTEVVTPTTASFSYIKGGTAVDLNSAATNDEANQTITVTVYDKAGNTSTSTFTAYYDDRVPEDISVASTILGNGIKFTRNVNIPLSNRSGTNYSVGLLHSGANNYIGNITTSGGINLTSFSTNSGSFYSPVPNANNLFTSLISFSKSGRKGNDNSDGIVLDTAINDSKTSIKEKNYIYDSVNKNYKVNLTNTLSSIRELVGLANYKITSSSNGVRLNDGVTIKNINSSGIEIDLSLVSGYYNDANTTLYSSTNDILLSTAGETKLKILLTDRLGNPKTIDYIIEIPNNITIIGKKVGETKQITTKINGTGKTKINSRKEE